MQGRLESERSIGCPKVLKARRVLDDCRHALTLLQNEVQADTFRVLWVAGVGLARAVGHVLQKIDAEQNDAVKRAVASAYTAWKADKADNAIFWEFIEEERNRVLKQYEAGFFSGPVDVLAGDEMHTLGENLFCPIIDGRFAGEDCRDILEQAIEWWTRKISEIEADVVSRAEQH